MKRNRQRSRYPFSGLLLLLFLVAGIAVKAQSEVSLRPKALPHATEGPTRDRPNILWIVCEDMSAHLPSYGDKTIPTPNIDRLAREGVRYRRMFSVNGVCSPSRSAIITGMYPNSIGSNHMRTGETDLVNKGVVAYEAVPPANVRCFPEYLRAVGYYCTNGNKTDYQFQAPFTTWDVNGKEGQQAPWRGRKTGQPFFSVINLGVTHESQIWLRANQPLRVEPAAVPLSPIYPDNSIIRTDVARNYDNIMVMDSLVGTVLRDLEADKLLDKTIVFFYSDHGSGMAWYKREIYDRGLHVPFIVRYPNRTGAGTWDDDLHSFVDLAPTLLSLAGVPIPTHLQGQAFLGDQKAVTPRRYIYAARDRFGEHYDCVRAVRDNRFKYIRNYQPDKPYYMDLDYRNQMPMMREILRLRDAGQLPPRTQSWFGPKPVEELYDTEKDPHELTNLARNATHRSKLAELRQAEQQWVRDVHDKGFMQERDLVQLFWPNSQQPTTDAPTVTVKEDWATVTCSTPGASIGFRLNEGDWQLYSSPVQVSPRTKLTVMATRIGYKPSSEVVVN